jgi:hypothetical protein
MTEEEIEKIVDDAIRLTVDEISTYLLNKAERCAEIGDGRQTILFETLAEYIYKEWGES